MQSVDVVSQLDSLLEKELEDIREMKLSNELDEVEALLVQLEAKEAFFRQLQTESRSFFNNDAEDIVSSVKNKLREEVLSLKLQNQQAQQELRELEQTHAIQNDLLKYATDAVLCKTDGVESTFSFGNTLNNCSHVVKVIHDDRSATQRLWEIVDELNAPVKCKNN